MHNYLITFFFCRALKKFSFYCGSRKKLTLSRSSVYVPELGRIYDGTLYSGNVVRQNLLFQKKNVPSAPTRSIKDSPGCYQHTGLVSACIRGRLHFWDGCINVSILPFCHNICYLQDHIFLRSIQVLQQQNKPTLQTLQRCDEGDEGRRAGLVCSQKTIFGGFVDMEVE